MERFLFLLAALLVCGCFLAGFMALLKFARADDLSALFYSGVCLTSGLSAQRLLGGSGDDE